MSIPSNQSGFMRSASAWQSPSAAIAYDVLSSMVSELAVHHERNACCADGLSLDWVSPSTVTRVVKYGNKSSLSSVINQVPDSILAEYQLNYCDVPIFSWKEYRWPHLQDASVVEPDSEVYIPGDCIDELMQYHIVAGTSWLHRYRARSRGQIVPKVDKVRIVAEPNRLELL